MRKPRFESGPWPPRHVHPFSRQPSRSMRAAGAEVGAVSWADQEDLRVSGRSHEVTSERPGLILMASTSSGYLYAESSSQRAPHVPRGPIAVQAPQTIHTRSPARRSGATRLHESPLRVRRHSADLSGVHADASTTSEVSTGTHFRPVPGQGCIGAPRLAAWPRPGRRLLPLLWPEQLSAALAVPRGWSRSPSRRRPRAPQSRP